MTRLPLLLVSFLLAVASGAHATDFGHHPAVRTAAADTGIDTNRFIVQPPASVTWTRAHSNAEHPAVTVARQHGASAVDANHFIVQPPATTTWTLGPAATAVVAAASFK